MTDDTFRLRCLKSSIDQLSMLMESESLNGAERKIAQSVLLHKQNLHTSSHLTFVPIAYQSENPTVPET